jgi:hypothetical protein
LLRVENEILTRRTKSKSDMAFSVVAGRVPGNGDSLDRFTVAFSEH